MSRGPPNIQPTSLMHLSGGASGIGSTGAANMKRPIQNASGRASGIAKSQSHLSGVTSSVDSGESIAGVASALSEWNHHALRKLVDAIGRKLLSHSPPSIAPLSRNMLSNYDVPQAWGGTTSNSISNHSTHHGRKSGLFVNASMVTTPVASPAFQVPSRMLLDTDPGALEGPRKLQFKAQWASLPRGGGVPSPTNASPSQSHTPIAISSTLTALKPPGGHTFPPTPATVPSTAQTSHSVAHDQSVVATHAHFGTQANVNGKSHLQPSIQSNGYAAPSPLISINLKEPVKLGGLPINRTAPEFIERLNRVRRARVYGAQLRQIMRSSAANSRASSRQGGRSQQPCKSSDSTGSSDGQARALPEVLAVRRQFELEAEDAKERRRKMREYAASIPKPKQPLLPPLSASSTGSIHNAAGRRSHAPLGSELRASMSPSPANGRIDGFDAENPLTQQLENPELEALTRQYMRDLAVFEKIKKGVVVSGVVQRQRQGLGSVCR